MEEREGGGGDPLQTEYIYTTVDLISERLALLRHYTLLFRANFRLASEAHRRELIYIASDVCRN